MTRPTPTPGADLALQAAYLDWFALGAQERLGRLPSLDEVQAVRRAILQAERACSAPGLVYEVTKGVWWAETGEDAGCPS